MAAPLTADDLLPLVKHLTLAERARLVRLISAPAAGDASAYRSLPPARDEFSNEVDPLTWEAEDWESFA